MQLTTDEIIDAVLRAEGSAYTNDPADPGGPTKYGITLNTLRTWRGGPTGPDDVKALTRTQAVEIYKKRYVKDPGYDRIGDARLRSLMVDMGVNHGTRRATKWLQREIGADDDGAIGPKTRSRLTASLNEGGTDRLIAHLVGVRCLFMARLAQTDANKVKAGQLAPDKSRALFISGWITRATAWLY